MPRPPFQFLQINPDISFGEFDAMNISYKQTKSLQYILKGIVNTALKADLGTHHRHPSRELRNLELGVEGTRS